MKTLLLHLLLSTSALATGAAPSPVVIAHRGASGYLPEHTLPSVAYAHALGADYLEQDIVLSKDRVPLVLHDIEIDTVTDVATRFPGRQRANGHFYAIDFTLAEIRQLRAHERCDPKTGRPVYPRRFPIGQSTFAVPTLEEELQFIQGLNRSTGRDTGIYPEIKAPAWHRAQGHDISAIVLEVLARYGYRTKADNFYLQCFDFAEVQRLRRELGFQGKIVQLVGRYGAGENEQAATDDARDNSDLLAPARLAEVARYADGIGPSLAHLVAVDATGHAQPNDVVARAHALGLVVHPYTFRTDALPKFSSDARALLSLLFGELRVDGIFADQPDVVRAYRQGYSR
ncbi:MAG: glycerophosphodiester phosphodiesterase [Opitutae bacterium]|nr:glycerophosphodiester phosphodiesterase [Opitutae bacterium]